MGDVNTVNQKWACLHCKDVEVVMNPLEKEYLGEPNREETRHYSCPRCGQVYYNLIRGWVDTSLGFCGAPKEPSHWHTKMEHIWHRLSTGQQAALREKGAA